jgi:propionate CoA-transferase
VFSSAQGDNEGHGLDHLARPGMLRRVVGGFFGTTPQLRDLFIRNEIEAYNLPQGQIAQLYRAIAAGLPGVVTHVGLHTYVDPRIEGGRLNARTQEDIVEVVQIGGREWLLYRAFPIDVALIRGTTADELGNISIEKEAVRMEGLPLAQATRNSGGLVIVQVERLVRSRSIHPQRVEIPGHLVDVVCVSERPAETHQQALGEPYNPAYSGEVQVPVGHLPELPFGPRKVIARRAARELCPGTVVNLGQGIPEGIGLVATEWGLLDQVWLSLESGVIGGVPTKHVNFGVSVNPMAITRHDDQFAFYNGGGVETTFLGFAQIDGTGAVNVSKFGGQFIGGGGFIDICMCAKRLVLCGQFDAGGTEYDLSAGRLRIVRAGRHRKLVERVEQVTFSGHHAVAAGRRVTLVTERAVFELAGDGWVLTEVAPGVRVREDILDVIGFVPRVDGPRPMENWIFQPDGAPASA